MFQYFRWREVYQSYQLLLVVLLFMSASRFFHFISKSSFMHTDALLSTTGIIITDKQRCGKLSAAVSQSCCRPLLGPSAQSASSLLTVRLRASSAFIILQGFKHKQILVGGTSRLLRLKPAICCLLLHSPVFLRLEPTDQPKPIFFFFILLYLQLLFAELNMDWFQSLPQYVTNSWCCSLHRSLWQRAWQHEKLTSLKLESNTEQRRCQKWLKSC